MSDDRNVAILNETLQILKDGRYRNVGLKLSQDLMKSAIVLLPETVYRICSEKHAPNLPLLTRCEYGCECRDSFTVARMQYDSYPHWFAGTAKHVLVLNLANPVHPGGGVREGAEAQEEDLCRKSSLLLSLESEAASSYYEYNRQTDICMGSDAMILSPEVEIIRDARNELLENTVLVSVLTCAAPFLALDMLSVSEEEYLSRFYARIMSVLTCAAFFGYRNLVLGAWGCGAFGNDARVVSDLFRKALAGMNYHGMGSDNCFRRIDFAVLDRSIAKYNLKEFSRNFGSY